MSSFKAYFYVYILGGLTFLPLLLGLVLIYSYYVLPQPSPSANEPQNDPALLVKNGDEKVVLKSGTDEIAEKFMRKHESDVASGYFAVTREYVPGGVNGKPPEIRAPAGEAVSAESPSVYQSMYRSIFDRVHKSTIEPTKDGAGRRTSNVFYVVLRHGHLMLYDDVQQLEVRYVISLEYHDVDIYAGGDEIPEAELWIKRNSIRLKRKKHQIGDKASSLPFYMFSENQSEKEDFYFAILNNMQKTPDSNPPVTQDFEIAHIVTLVQRLHSSEEHLQTRWLNALLGRAFLAVYKTPEIESVIRQKLTKKISRVKKPDFITKLALQKVDTGTAAPFFTNPRLKDLTVNGDCTVEADVEYSGGIRVELAATVRIDLGKRLGAREVDIVLAATCKKLSGHVLARFKPPPSNRVWVTFEKVPKLDLKLEPIVSSRQITYGFILRALESRILEVIAETIVLPFWDDIPFTHTEGEPFRGGIWKKETPTSETTEIRDEAAEDEAKASEDVYQHTIGKNDRVLSMPMFTDHPSTATPANAPRSIPVSKEALSSNYDGARTPERASRQNTPRILRSTSFASAADPMVSPSYAPAESPAIDIQGASKRDSMLKDLSARSLGTSPDSSEVTLTDSNDRIRANSMASNLSNGSVKVARRGTAETDTTLVGSITSNELTDEPESKRSSLHGDAKAGLAAAGRAFANTDHQKTIASINAAKEAAQKWGWGVIARRQREAEAKLPNTSTDKVDTSQPMGRGQPLPPPGIPLPRPPKPGMFSFPKKLSVQPSSTPQDGSTAISTDTTTLNDSPPKPPALPDRDRRRRQSHIQISAPQDDELLVVEAPHDSAPTTPVPATDEHHDEFFGHGERDEEKRINSTTARIPPPLPQRSDTAKSPTFDDILKAPKRTPPPLPQRLSSTGSNPKAVVVPMAQSD